MIIVQVFGSHLEDKFCLLDIVTGKSYTTGRSLERKSNPPEPASSQFPPITAGNLQFAAGLRQQTDRMPLFTLSH